MMQSKPPDIPGLVPLTWEIGPVTRDGRELRMPVSARESEVRRVTIGSRRILDRFCRLATADEPTIHQFAQKYGVLKLCAKHDLPGDGPGHRCSPRGSNDGASYVEDIRQWRTWARRFRGTLAMASAIRAGKHPAIEDVRDAFDVPSPRVDEASGEIATLAETLALPAYVPRDGLVTVSVAGVSTTGRGFMGWSAESFLDPQRKPHVRRWRFRQWINALLAVAQVGPVLVFRARDWRIADGVSPTSPLFGALVLELAYRCAQGDLVKRCDDCQEPFAPQRGTDRFCKECREARVPEKWAARAYRARLREKGLSARGRPLKR